MTQMVADAVRQAGVNFVDTVTMLLPRILITVSIVAVGWVIAWALKWVVRWLLIWLRFALIWIGVFLGLVVPGQEQAGNLFAVAFPFGLLSSVFTPPWGNNVDWIVPCGSSSSSGIDTSLNAA